MDYYRIKAELEKTTCENCRNVLEEETKVGACVVCKDDATRLIYFLDNDRQLIHIDYLCHAHRLLVNIAWTPKPDVIYPPDLDKLN